MTRTNATYDDGEIKFYVGCSFTTNIDGNNKHVGVNSVTFKLCEPAINDWTLATHRTAALIAELELANPNLVNLQEFRKTASLEEAEKNWGGRLVDRWTKVVFPLNEEQANQFLKNAADAGHIQQLQFNQGSYLSMAAIMNDKVSIDIGISKETYWGERI